MKHLFLFFAPCHNEFTKELYNVAYFSYRSGCHMGKDGRWMRPRHRVMKRLVSPFFNMTVKKYNCEVTPFDTEGRNRLVLVNHQTDIDQYIISSAFREPVYFVAMEDLFSRGFFSRFMSWGAAPIPILKGTVDVKAVRNCLKVAKEGGTIVLFPEGNRTYSGRTCFIGPQISKFVKLIKLPLVIMRIEGGYGVKPRWSDHMRKGTMSANATLTVEPQEYLSMGNDELYELICRELCTDETPGSAEYFSDRAAEGLERVFYVCPECGLTEYVTDGSRMTCTKCGRSYILSPDQKLTDSVSGETMPLSEMYDRQESFIRELDLSMWKDVPAFTDTVELYEVIVYKNKRLIEKNVKTELYSDRIVFTLSTGPVTRTFDDISAMPCVQDHKLNVYCSDGLFQIIGDTHYNALKYCNFYYHYKFIKEGNNNGEFQFLGL